MFIPEDESIFLVNNHKTQTVAELAKNLKRGTVKVNQWLAFLGLEAKKRDPQPRNHPFRMQNRRLEAMIIENRQEKSKKFK